MSYMELIDLNPNMRYGGQDISRMSTPSPSPSSLSSSYPHPSRFYEFSTTGYDMGDFDDTAPLEPPRVPFRASRASSHSSMASAATKNGGEGDSRPVSMASSDSKAQFRSSLSTHYFPSKFSSVMLSGGPRRRKAWKGADEILPKQGGGREAFKSNEARMPADDDEDYDGIDVSIKQTKSRTSWNKFKWTLFGANCLFTLYSIGTFIACFMLWFNIWQNADVLRVGNRTELILSTLAASVAVITAAIGWSGILLNNRAFLAVYCFLLWICFGLLVTPGYITYKKRTFNLAGKLNQQWSEQLGLDGRLLVQNQLHCCGYYSPFVEATVSATCYARSTLPGCKGPYVKFEKKILEWWYAIIFSLVPAQIFVMVIGLLCSNHITYRFGKGMMPREYRLDLNSISVIMENYASQLAEEYGPDVAKEIVRRSQSTLQLENLILPTVPYSASRRSSGYTSTPTASRVGSFSGKQALRMSNMSGAT